MHWYVYKLWKDHQVKLSNNSYCFVCVCVCVCVCMFDFPDGSDGKASAYNAKTRFSPWVGKISWRRKWQPTPVFLPGKSHGQRSLVGYSPWGHSVCSEDLRSLYLANFKQWALRFCMVGWKNFASVFHCTLSNKELEFFHKLDLYLLFTLCMYIYI